MFVASLFFRVVNFSRLQVVLTYKLQWLFHWSCCVSTVLRQKHASSHGWGACDRAGYKHYLAHSVVCCIYMLLSACCRKKIVPMWSCLQQIVLRKWTLISGKRRHIFWCFECWNWSVASRSLYLREAISNSPCK